MRNDFMTWEDWEAPSAQLKCMIQDLVCGIDCYKPTVTMTRSTNGFITFTGPAGSFVFKEGGISTQVGNDIIAGTPDGLAYFQEKETVINSLAVAGTDLAITYTNETEVAQTASVPLANICNACTVAAIAPAAFVSADLLNAITLGTDGKLYVPTTATTVAIPQTNTFNVTAGSSVTLTHTPLATHHVHVFRNGAIQRLTSDYSIVGPTVTFLTAFGDTLNSAADGEEILVTYYRA